MSFISALYASCSSLVLGIQCREQHCLWRMYVKNALAHLSLTVSLSDVVNMLGLPPSPTTSRLLAIGCLVLCLILHGVIMNVGVKVQNSLGIFKLAVLLAIALSGLLSLAGAPGFAVKPGYDVAHNFEWDTFWEGSGQGSNAFVAGLYNVIWYFICSP